MWAWAGARVAARAVAARAVAAGRTNVGTHTILRRGVGAISIDPARQTVTRHATDRVLIARAVTVAATVAALVVAALGSVSRALVVIRARHAFTEQSLHGVRRRGAHRVDARRVAVTVREAVGAEARRVADRPVGVRRAVRVARALTALVVDAYGSIAKQRAPAVIRAASDALEVLAVLAIAALVGQVVEARHARLRLRVAIVSIIRASSLAVWVRNGRRDPTLNALTCVADLMRLARTVIIDGTLRARVSAKSSSGVRQ